MEPGQIVTPDTPVGIVSWDEEHTHVEFWDTSGTLELHSPYDYMSEETLTQFMALAANMSDTDSRVTFHPREDGLWQSWGDQPALLYGKKNPNLNQNEPGYDNPWD